MLCNVMKCDGNLWAFFFFFLRNVQERQKLKQASYRLWWQQDISDYLPNTYTNAHLIYI